MLKKIGGVSAPQTLTSNPRKTRWLTIYEEPVNTVVRKRALRDKLASLLVCAKAD